MNFLVDLRNGCCEVEPEELNKRGGGNRMKDYPPYLDYPKPRKPQTNYDCVISKTPEEMAEFLSHGVWHWECENCKKPRRHMIKDSDCTKCWLNWLVSIVREN